MKQPKHYTFLFEPTSILFVCTGNTCRSPMAEAIAKKWLEANGKQCLISSAGVETIPGWPAADHAIALGSPYLDNHQTQIVSSDLLARFDVVFTMTPGHFHGLIRLFPSHAGSIYPLALDGSPIDDPYGGEVAEYARVYSILEEHVRTRMNELFFQRLS